MAKAKNEHRRIRNYLISNIHLDYYSLACHKDKKEISVEVGFS